MAVNAFTVLNDAKQLGLTVEGFDLINFGSSNASGRTQAVVGGGFRSRLLKNLDLGFAYEAGVTKPCGLFDDRFTVDFIWRFERAAWAARPMVSAGATRWLHSSRLRSRRGSHFSTRLSRRSQDKIEKQRTKTSEPAEAGRGSLRREF